jgi:signal transduction histidine kinase
LLSKTIVERLAAHRLLSGAPRSELEWLAARGTLRRYEAGTVVATESQPLESLWVFLSGHVVIYVDRGSGPRKVMEWRGGDLSGILPYSRMKASPGKAVALEETEAFELHSDHFPELIRECYCVTSACVHTMVDRARVFTTTDLHDERIRSLGHLAAYLTHELNNPTSAVARSAMALGLALKESDSAARAVGAACLDEPQLAAIDQFLSAVSADSPDPALTSLERSDREEAITNWLIDHGADDRAAPSLGRLPAPLPALDRLATLVDRAALPAVVRYVAAEVEARTLAVEIERAASRISGLVAAVKRFTYLDQATAPKPVDIGIGLRDTVTILNPKARTKAISVSLDIQAGLPMVLGFGGDLNQVWMNLVDNAIDAAPQHGHVTVTAVGDGKSIVVRVVDDGPGIPDEIRGRIFEPFFTTKPPGEGTGMGLDIASRVVARHEGEIEVSSVPGRTEFRVTLPTA